MYQLKNTIFFFNSLNDLGIWGLYKNTLDSSIIIIILCYE